MDQSNSDAPVLAWLRLLRLPNVFTAITNVSIGYFVADAGFRRPTILIGLCAASACLYCAGMVLNDVYDLDLDRRERPERPLPAGAISPTAAARAGWSLLVGGVLIAVLVGVWAEHQSPIYLAPPAIAAVLATVIVLYDAKAKSTVFGPLVMGGCRTLNVLMGVAVTQTPERWQTSTPWMIALGIGFYVMGITWFARDEAQVSQRPLLIGGLVLMLIGLTLLILFPNAEDFHEELRHVAFQQTLVWPLLLCLFTASVWRRAISAIMSVAPRDVQATIKQALLTLISIDATLALLLAGPIPAVVIVLLMIPANLLARRIAMT